MDLFSASEDFASISELSLSQKLYASKRLYSAQIEGGWVVFAPDQSGFPSVIDEWSYRILKKFENGSSVSEVLESVDPSDPESSVVDAFEVIDFLREKNFVRASEDPDRYSPYDNTKSEPNSFGVWLHINNHCNLDCDYCFVDKSKVEMTDEVMSATIDRLVSTVEMRGIESLNLKFAGGEPTLSVEKMAWFHAHLKEALTHTSCDLSVAVLSNGTVANERLIEFLQRPGVGIGISLDGYGPAGHDIFRTFTGTKKGSWDIIERNIEKFLANGIRPYVMSTISQQSASTLVDLVKWIFSKGLRTRLSVVRQPDSSELYSSFSGRALQLRLDDEYRKLNSCMIEAFEAAFTELEKEKYDIDIRNALHVCELHFENPSYSSCCGIGNTHVVINERGENASCPMTVHRGTVQPQNDLIAATRETFIDHNPMDRLDSKGKNCLDCQWFPVCVSGCPINNISVYGQAFTVSPLHEYYEYVIPRYVKLFGRKLVQSALKRNISSFRFLEA